jgi:acyl carrier protein
MEQIREQLIQIWKELLEVESVETTDNFFELGGNSISIMELFEVLNKLYPEKVKIVDIFTYPTVETLASLISVRIGEDKVERIQDIEF